MRLLFLFKWVLSLLWFLCLPTYAQTQRPACATEPVSGEFLQLVRQGVEPLISGARLGTEPQRLAIKATLLVGIAYTPPSPAMLDTVLVHLNRYFKPLNISFYWLGQPNVVRDDTYANSFDMTRFDAIRARYDVDNAINLYFGYSSPYGGGRSFAYAPAALKNSNCIYLNWFLPSIFRNEAYMLSYVLPHEFGHYFGLNHTFTNSNSVVVSDRELVTRGPKANCALTGDYICDTPADPYERGNWSVDGANCRFTSSLVDANGDFFNTDVKNFMSYYGPTICPGAMHFTAGQYQRMQLGLAVRLTNTCFGNEAYSITGPDAALPKVSIDRITVVDNGKLSSSSVQPVCIGATVRLAYSTIGSFQPGEPLLVESTTNPHSTGTLTSSYTRLPSATVVGHPNQLDIRFTDSSRVGVHNIFYIRVRPAQTTAISCVGAISFIVYKPGTTRVTFTNTPTDTITIDYGQQVTMRVRAEHSSSGEAYGRGRLLVNEQPIPYQTEGFADGQLINMTMYKTSRIRLLDGVVACGFVNLAGNLTVRVRPPTVVLHQPDKLVVCAGSTLRLPFSSSVTSGVINYRAQLSNVDGYFPDDSTSLIGVLQQNRMVLHFPSSLPTGTAYRIRLQVNTPQGWVAALPGEALHINELPTATLQTAPATIFVGDSSRLSFTLTGQSPWLLTINNGPVLTLTDPQGSVFVKPDKTTVYQPTSVQDACGTGMVSGSTTITIRQPLATDQPTGESGLRLWPNPTDGEVTVAFKAPAGQLVTLRITDVAGRLIQTVVKKGSGMPERHRLNVRHLAAGAYQLSCEQLSGTQSLRFLKK